MHKGNSGQQLTKKERSVVFAVACGGRENGRTLFLSVLLAVVLIDSPWRFSSQHVKFLWLLICSKGLTAVNLEGGKKFINFVFYPWLRLRIHA